MSTDLAILVEASADGDAVLEGAMVRASEVARHGDAPGALRILAPVRATVAGLGCRDPSLALRVRHLHERWTRWLTPATGGTAVEALASLHADACAAPDDGRWAASLRGALVDDLSALGDHERCVAWARRAAAQAPRDGADREALARLARVLARAGVEHELAGDRDAAEAAFHEALAIGERCLAASGPLGGAPVSSAADLQDTVVRAGLGLERVGARQVPGLLGRARSLARGALADGHTGAGEQLDRVALLGLVQAHRGERGDGELRSVAIRRGAYVLESSWSRSAERWVDPHHACALVGALLAVGRVECARETSAAARRRLALHRGHGGTAERAVAALA